MIKNPKDVTKIISVEPSFMFCKLKSLCEDNEVKPDSTIDVSFLLLTEKLVKVKMLSSCSREFYYVIEQPRWRFLH